MPFLLLAFLLTSSAAGLVPVARAHGVEVWRRPGHAIELLAQGDIAAPPDRVRAVLLDYANHPHWVEHLAESRVLERGPDSELVYERLDLPVLDDRDYTLLVTWGQAEAGDWIRFTCDNARGPAPRHGVVRVSLHEGSWLLEPIDGGRATRARYEFKLDLAGSLPSWMGRSRAGKDVPALYQAIRRQVAR